MVWFINKNKFYIFIHIPKCAGTSIEKATNTIDKEENGYGIIDGDTHKSYQHYLWSDYVSHLGKEKFESAFKFSLCRNPYTRIVSVYHFYSKFSKMKFSDFLEYIKNYLNNSNQNTIGNTIENEHLIPQYRFLFDHNDKLKINKLFKFEQFNEIETFFKNELGINKIEKIFVSPAKQKHILTQQERDIIYNLYEKDFLLLGYSR